VTRPDGFSSSSSFSSSSRLPKEEGIGDEPKEEKEDESRAKKGEKDLE
jgi:hypothetical protein